MILRLCSLFYIGRGEIDGLLQVLKSMFLISFICIVGSDAVVGPCVFRVGCENFLEIGDGFIVMLSQLLRHGHIIKSLHIIRIDGKRFLNCCNAFFRR